MVVQNGSADEIDKANGGQRTSYEKSERQIFEEVSQDVGNKISHMRDHNSSNKGPSALSMVVIIQEGGDHIRRNYTTFSDIKKEVMT